ncbi:hypothetical protein [Tropicibacter sp. S64]|uniref:hypothetical protein n=1 Tax=Tropicibacter sp. S64 TaxID=3415122 RepID=UPI003C799A8D
MKGIAFIFMGLATVSALIGMAWGIQMSASGDHSLFPAHAHLNLLGYVSFAIFAFYYHMVEGADHGFLPKLHAAVAVLGVVLIVPGIVFAIRESGEVLAKAGSVLTLLSMLIFAVVVVTTRRR